ncbi:nitroreductase [Leucobacter sp. CSA2]|uniref:Putative NAD(P)H nitroreductase n=1 Tax=Leucobacter edaphi TaxID=2796472 RepID=A0A934QF84_9MICO|nr:nitroreductase [Leucobacter edaphi]MBK0422412.1 nitroreductase [Leucobacter edaphi]
MSQKPPVQAAVEARRSYSKVTDEAPGQAELERMIASLVSLPDHSGLRPWRFIALRGAARDRLGHGLAAAAKTDPEKYVSKARRAPLVIAIVVSPRPSDKVPLWEQEAVASGAAHTLALLLHEAGWGVIWRTGELTRKKAVRKALGIKKPEYLLGWLYVGGIPPRNKTPKPRKPLQVERHLTTLVSGPEARR